MEHEQQKMLQQPQAPARYFLVTAYSLSPANKAAIHQAMRPFILSTNDIWLNSANRSLIDFLHRNIADNPPLIDTLISSLEHFYWRLDHFKVTAQSKHPIGTSATPREHLMHKLVELLPQQSSKLLLTFTNAGSALEWVNWPDSFETQLTKLWRIVMSNTQQAEAILQQMQFLLASDAQSWESLLLQDGIEELLDLTRYVAVDQQESIWLLAMDNLHNSEDAAAFSELYQQETKAKLIFKKQKRKFIHKLLNAGSEEIDRTNDTGFFNAIRKTYTEYKKRQAQI